MNWLFTDAFRNMKVLLTGGSGFIGRQLADELSQSRTPFLIASRATKLDISNHSSVSVGDIDGLTQWNSALVGITHVVHLAARVHITTETSSDAFAAFRSINTDGTLNLARQSAALGVKRFIFVSTIKVNGEGRNSAYLETDKPAPQDAYAASKLEAEQGLWTISAETGMEVVILRIPLVYGPGVGANFFQLLKIIDQRWPLPLCGINNRRSLIYSGNLVNAILCSLQHPKAANQLFLLSDGQDASTTQLVTWLAQALGKQTRMFTVSEGLLRSVAGFVGKSSAVDRLFGSLYLDSTKFQRELGWSPPSTLQEGLEATVNWYREHLEKGVRAKQKKSTSEYFIKRSFDVLLASIAIFLLAVPILLVTVCVWVTSKGPAIYWSQRVGRNNRPFNMPKFRSMRTNTPALATHLLQDPDQWLTPIGSFLRKSSLDELPQLWSILKGDMSFVGPRPALYNQDDLIALRTQAEVHLLQPGLTGWAQVNGRDEIPIPDKVKLDAVYMQRQSLWFDIYILWLTVLKVIRRDGVSH